MGISFGGFNLPIMQLFHHAAEAATYAQSLRMNGKSLGLVPTMGALHEAHLALARRAMRENDFCVVSIFVNPTQFNNPEDLEKYPRRTESDLALLREQGIQMVFLPSVKDIYGSKIESEAIDLAGLDQGMEGHYRPGHFAGVATVIKRFFEILKPQRAYFGQKDYQQLRVIEHLNQSLQMGVEVVGCPTERSTRGLALSSRNYRLSEKGLDEALAIYTAEAWAREHWPRLSPQELKKGAWEQLQASPLEPEYVEIADVRTMKPIEEKSAGQEPRIFVAAYCEGVRLIDNLSLL